MVVIDHVLVAQRDPKHPLPHQRRASSAATAAPMAASARTVRGRPTVCSIARMVAAKVGWSLGVVAMPVAKTSCVSLGADHRLGVVGLAVFVRLGLAYQRGTGVGQIALPVRRGVSSGGSAGRPRQPFLAS
jgi:hypothetical protein